MEKEQFRILLMDDEVEVSGQAKLAYEELTEAGYKVDKCEKMSTVLENFYQDFYHLYILDIDMQKVDDTVEGTGMTVGETLKRLSSMSQILIFSALGTVDDWFEAANYNFRGYVHKQKGISSLLDKVEEIRLNYYLSKDTSLETEEVIAAKALLYYKESDKLIPQNRIVEVLQEQGMEEVDVVGKLQKLITKAKDDSYQIILLCAERFSNRVSVQNKLKEILALIPTPQIIIAIYGEENDINNIIPLVNLRPFRLFNLKWTNFITRLEKGVGSALMWYGKEEILDFPEKEKLFRSRLGEKEKQKIIESEEMYHDKDFVLDFEESNEEK